MVRQVTRSAPFWASFARVCGPRGVPAAGMGGALRRCAHMQPTRAISRGDSRIVNRQVEESAPHESWRFDGFQITLLRGLSPARLRLERALRDAGRGLPMQHRISWVSVQERPNDHWLLSVEDAAGHSCGAVGVQVSPSRALPGHRLLRVERFGPGIPPQAHAAAIQVLISLARRDRRVLRLYVESLAFEPNVRAELESTLATAGFVRLPSPRSYEHTLVLPLEGDEESILASFHRSARQNVRNTSKYGVRVAPIVDPAHFARLDEIAAETFARTGGRYSPFDWGRIAAASAREPGASRLVGVYRTDQEGPASLLAFAWGCGHGDHVHYSAAGCTRITDRRIPLLYPLIWDLIVWAKRSGAKFFDFGGVSAGTLASEDPLGGISDFKRYFTPRLVQVGAEWAYEPRPRRAQAARMMKSASTMLSRMLARA